MAGMRDLIPHDLLQHVDAEYKRQPIDFRALHKPDQEGVYHKRGGAFDNLFNAYMSQ